MRLLTGAANRLGFDPMRSKGGSCIAIGSNGSKRPVSMSLQKLPQHFFDQKEERHVTNPLPKGHDCADCVVSCRGVSWRGVSCRACSVASESSDSSEEEDVPARKQSFVPALNLTDVKKKGDNEAGGGKEKKGLLGTYSSLPTLCQRICFT
jgi:hypothetical protein